MRRSARRHSSDEFGKTSGSGSPYAGLDGPMIGAPSSILVDGIAEQESGKTPTPPPISVRVLVVVLIVMFVVGLIGVALVLRFLPPPDFSILMVR